MNAPNPQGLWSIGLSAWIIQDGNYPDFAVGDAVEFAVEYYRQPGAEISSCDSEPRARLLSEPLYDVVAKKVLETGDMTVLDIGILVYQRARQAAEPGGPGTRFRTRLHLGVDPFLYFEQLSKIEGALPLIYSWRVVSILRQTAPFIEIIPTSSYPSSRSVRVRDQSKLGYETIERTNAWEDDNGFGEYVLRCELLPIDPRSMRGRRVG
jgi:hypothetical protein